MTVSEKSDRPGRLRRTATTLAAVALSVLLTAVFAAPAGAAGVNRNVDQQAISRYCQSTGNGTAVLVRNDAYGWQCRGPRGTSGVDMERLCSGPNLSNPFARTTNFYDPYSWKCMIGYGVVSQVTAADFSAFCKRFGYTGASSGTNAYSWACTSPNRRDAFSVLQVCTTMKLPGRLQVVDRFRNFYDPNSWECRQ